MVTICSNTETLRPIWADIYEAAGLTDSHDWDESVAVVWCKKFAELLDAADFEWRYESSFQKWHGGPYRGTYHYDGPLDGVVAKIRDAADAAARNAAQADVDSMAESDAE